MRCILMSGGYTLNGAVVVARRVVTQRFTDYFVLGWCLQGL